MTFVAKLGGGQYFAAEGREIEGPLPKDVFGSFPNAHSGPNPQVFPTGSSVAIFEND